MGTVLAILRGVQHGGEGSVVVMMVMVLVMALVMMALATSGCRSRLVEYLKLSFETDKTSRGSRPLRPRSL